MDVADGIDHDPFRGVRIGQCVAGAKQPGEHRGVIAPQTAAISEPVRATAVAVPMPDLVQSRNADARVRGRSPSSAGSGSYRFYRATRTRRFGRASSSTRAAARSIKRQTPQRCFRRRRPDVALRPALKGLPRQYPVRPRHVEAPDEREMRRSNPYARPCREPRLCCRRVAHRPLARRILQKCCGATNENKRATAKHL